VWGDDWRYANKVRADKSVKLLYTRSRSELGCGTVEKTKKKKPETGVDTGTIRKNYWTAPSLIKLTGSVLMLRDPKKGKAGN